MNPFITYEPKLCLYNMSLDCQKMEEEYIGAIIILITALSY